MRAERVVAIRAGLMVGPYDHTDRFTYWPARFARGGEILAPVGETMPVQFIDVRDVAASCRLSLAAPFEAIAGCPALIIAAADTVMNRPSAALFAEVFPGVALTRDIGEFETLLAIDRAREVIGYEPQHSWRDLIHES